MLSSILIVSGQSGSGKSTAIRTLEDHGYYCVDNMPLSLAENLIGLLNEQTSVERLALVIDIRERQFFRDAPALLQRLRAGDVPARLVYLEAKDESIIRRYSETRRIHPLDEGDGLRNAIGREQSILAPMRELADETLDTSDMSPHALRNHISTRIAGVAPGDAMRIAFVSFGFKHGLPLDADIVLDVRFLPNPYFQPELRDQTGLQQPVRDFVLSIPTAGDFIDRTMDFLRFLIPQYQAEGKRYLTVAIGCTGGQHRSVTIAGELERRLGSRDMKVDLRHRDVRERR